MYTMYLATTYKYSILIIVFRTLVVRILILKNKDSIKQSIITRSSSIIINNVKIIVVGSPQNYDVCVSCT